MFISKKKLGQIKSDAWQDGFDTGRKKAVNETRKVFIKLLTTEIMSVTSSSSKGLQRAIQIIRTGKR